MDESKWRECSDPSVMLRWLDEPTSSVYGYRSDRDRLPSDRKLRLYAVSVGASVHGDISEFEMTLAWIDGETPTPPPGFTSGFRDFFDGPAYPAVTRLVEVFVEGKGGVPPATAAALLRDVVHFPGRPPYAPVNNLRCGNCGKDALVVLKKDLLPTHLSVCSHCHHDGPPWSDVMAFRRIPWRDRQVLAIAHAAYRDLDDLGRMKPEHLGPLADALADLGADEPCIHCGGLGIYKTGYVKHTSSGVVDTRHEIDCVACGATGRVPHEVIDHLHAPGPHVRGCWAVDLVTGKG